MSTENLRTYIKTFDLPRDDRPVEYVIAWQSKNWLTWCADEIERLTDLVETLRRQVVEVQNIP